MKKVLLVLAVAGVMVACNSKKKEDKKVEGDTTTKVTDGPTDNPNTNPGVPKFADAEIQKYVDDYTAFVIAAEEAYKTKDATKIQAVSANMMDWSNRSMDIAKRFTNNPDDARKFGDYVGVLSKRLTDAAMSMYPQK